ncbi:uncharacterized protein EpC_29750 [Erwinia pyrifoliae Ep1/96]|nr:uncharacterized protein EpC_29750 [Erwinia pyrifoliae Ep1/96]
MNTACLLCCIAIGKSGSPHLLPCYNLHEITYKLGAVLSDYPESFLHKFSGPLHGVCDLSYNVTLQKTISAPFSRAWPNRPLIDKFLPQGAPAADICFASLQLEVCDV